MRWKLSNAEEEQEIAWLIYILSMEFLIRLFQLLLMVFIHATSTCGKAITCTAGDFPVGANASLVCYFPDDIDNHDSVLVQYSPFSAPTDASYVFHCKAEDVKASKCNEQDGYVLKSHTRNTLLVEIANITEKAAGRYKCQFLPPDKSPMETCSLTVRGKTAGVTPMEKVGVSQDSSTINVQSGETGTVSVETLVGWIVAVIVVVAVIIIIVVIVFRRRHKRPAETQGIEIVDRPMMKRTIDTQVSVERALAAPLINTQRNGNKAPATGLAEKRRIQTQVSVDSLLKGLASPLINTQSSGTKPPATGLAEKRSIQTQVSVDCLLKGLASPLINTQSSGTKPPATGLAEKRSIQTQVSADSLLRELASPLINTQSSGIKTPAARTTGFTPV